MSMKLIIVVLALVSSTLHITAQITPGLTADFQTWLNQTGYESYNFMRTDIDPLGASYGGKQSQNEQITNDPIIFIHGNSDKAIGFTGWQTGFTNSIEYFISQGYTEAELYATTWGPADAFQMANQYHSFAYLSYLRAFVEAVLNYTGAAQVDIISHSMGVTLGRKVVQGGTGNDNGPYNLGPSLLQKVDTFIGIAGANWGLTNCYSDSQYPTCGTTNGLYPGWAIGPLGLSTILNNINNGPNVATHLFSLWSSFDNLIGYGDIVWMQPTSNIPNQNGHVEYTDPFYTHLTLKDNTTQEQYQIITQHVTGDYKVNTLDEFIALM
jgi:hypothetical protein